ncbi:MAG: hypothetical protein K6U12_13030 [Armatimonadetes bacterium]|nr:hypothetical protein [Armatimonadota bacterium]
MKTQRTTFGKGFALTVLGTLLACACSQQPSTSEAPTMIEDPREKTRLQIVQARQMGLRKAPPQIDLLLEWFRTPASPSYEMGFGFAAPLSYHRHAAAMTALGRLADARTLPELEAQKSRLWRSAHFRAHYARIHAELLYPAPRNAQQWREKIDAYLQVVKLTQEQLAEYFRSQPVPEIVDYGDPQPVEIIAVRVLVEMAGEAYANGVREAFEVLRWVDYERDPVSALRAGLAKTPAPQRVAWLIGQIMSREVVRFSDHYLVQALADCGAEAVPAILEAMARLKQREEVRYAPVKMLLEALSVIEYAEGRPSLKRLAADSNAFIAETAQYLLRYALMFRASDW